MIHKYFKDKYVSSLEFRLRKIDEIKHSDLMSEKYNLNYVKNLLILSSTVTACFSFCICFISTCSCRYYELCNRNKNLCNHCGN